MNLLPSVPQAFDPGPVPEGFERGVQASHSNDLHGAIARYAADLEARADHSGLFASVLRATAHRLRHLLADYPKPHVTVQYGVRVGREIHSLDTMAAAEKLKGRKLYTREVTRWQEVK